MTTTTEPTTATEPSTVDAVEVVSVEPELCWLNLGDLAPQRIELSVGGRRSRLGLLAARPFAADIVSRGEELCLSASRRLLCSLSSLLCPSKRHIGRSAVGVGPSSLV